MGLLALVVGVHLVDAVAFVVVIGWLNAVTLYWSDSAL